LLKWLEKLPSNIKQALNCPGVVVTVTVMAGLYLIVLLAMTSRHYDKPDFSQDYVYAFAMRGGQNPYSSDLTSVASRLHLTIVWKRATYTPTFILCIEPLTLVSPSAAWWIWTALNVAFLLAALLMLLRDHFDLMHGLLLTVITILYAPLVSHFHFGQTQILILLLLTLAMRWLRKRRDVAAGAALAMATLLRLYPLVLVAYLVLLNQADHCS
jgi:Glycosyltransferase family 87